MATKRTRWPIAVARDPSLERVLAERSIVRCLSVLEAFWDRVGAAEPFPTAKEIAAMGRTSLFDIAMDVVGRSDPPLMYSSRDEYNEVFLAVLAEIGENRKIDIPLYPTTSHQPTASHPKASSATSPSEKNGVR